MLFSEIYKTISQKEKKIILVVILFLIVFSSFPFWYGHFTQSEDKVFLYFNSLVRGDRYVYYSYIKQAIDGNFLFSNLFTTEAQPHKMLNVLWLIPGLLGRIFHLKPHFAYEIFREFLIIPSVLLIYLMLAYFFSDFKKKIISFALICFGSGIGVLTYNFWNVFYSDKTYWNAATDLYVPESNFFLSLYVSPHFLASIMLLYLSLFLLFIAFEKNSVKKSIWGGLCALILFSFHPFHILTVFFIPFAFIIVKSLQNKKIDRQKIKLFFIFAAISSPSIIYYLYLLSNDHLLLQKSLQNYCPSPNIIFLALGFGGLLFFGIWGIYQSYKNKKLFLNDLYLYFFVWIIVQFVLLYFPINFQRRLIEGWQLPLVFFSALSLTKLYESKKYIFTKFKIALLFLIFLLFFFSNFFNVIRDSYYYTQKLDVFYFKKDIYQAIIKIGDYDKNKAVLADFIISNRIPGIIGFPVYLGHGVETAYYDIKVANFIWFFEQKTSDEKRVEFLQNNNIGYLIYTPDMNKTGFAPETKDFFEKIYDSADAKVYKTVF